jgi:hypothetical protein
MNRLRKKLCPKSKRRICVAVSDLQNGQAAEIVEISRNNKHNTKTFMFWD